MTRHTIFFALMLSPWAPPAASADAGSCGALVDLELPDTVIVSAQVEAHGEFKEPDLPFPGVAVPEHCRVAGVIRPTSGSHIRFEVWMPTEKWNGKLIGAGNGGFGGRISTSIGLAEAVQRGYAGVSTDTGHTGDANQSDWARGNLEKIVDFGHRAIHLMTVNAKSIIEEFYGHPPKRSYFLSCSNGGRQGLMEAQRYPEDFDGIVAGAPAYDWTGLMTSFAWTGAAQQRQGSAHIPTNAAALIERAALEQCDHLDGRADGVITEPRSCPFDPSQLLCTPDQEDDCLTAQQVKALTEIHRGARNSDGVLLFPGFPVGGEVGDMPNTGWDGWILGDSSAPSEQQRMIRGFMRNFDGAGPEWTETRFDFDRDPDRLRRKFGPHLNATDPDLSAFAARGGKLILYHGWSDAAIPAQSTINYYEAIVAHMGANKAESFLRLFLVPGMQHCAGGRGPSAFNNFAAPIHPLNPERDIAAALEAWVEMGRAPNSIIATKDKNPLQAAVDYRLAETERTGRVCAFRKRAGTVRAGPAGSSLDNGCSINGTKPSLAGPRHLPLPDTISREARDGVQPFLESQPEKAEPISIDEMRALAESFQNDFLKNAGDGYPISIRHEEIAGIPVKLIMPLKLDAAHGDSVLLNLHGGGFKVDSGSLTESVPIAALTGIRVISVSYRLAPETPFPGARDDVIAVYRALLETHAPENIAIFGTSAGAILTAQVLAKIRDIGLPLPAGAGIFSGTADIARMGDSEQFFPPLAGLSISQNLADYAGTWDLRDPEISPLYSDLSGWPPTLLVTSTRDVLLSQTAILHRALLRASVDAELVVFEAMPHAFWNLTELPESREALDLMAKFLTDTLTARR